MGKETDRGREGNIEEQKGNKNVCADKKLEMQRTDATARMEVVTGRLHDSIYWILDMQPVPEFVFLQE